MKSVVIALGGNSVLEEGEKPTFETQFSHVMKATESIAKMLSKRDFGLVITHGNGPQVGDELLRNEIGKKAIPRLPLFSINAETQALIGSMIEVALRNSFVKFRVHKDIAVVLTHMVVDRKDPAFRKPAKPIGPFYTESELKRELRLEKFDYAAERGEYRKVVASPSPRQVLEIDSISRLVGNGKVVIAGGGGGVPVYRKGGKLIGVDAVIDKDYEARLIASSINASEMIILTDVDYVYSDFPNNKKAIRSARAKYIKRILGTLEAGTMYPKIRACVDFIENGGKRAYVGNLSKLGEIVDGTSGTVITK